MNIYPVLTRSFNPDNPARLTLTLRNYRPEDDVLLLQVDLTEAMLGKLADDASSLLQDIQRAGYYGNQSDDQGNRMEAKT